MSARRLFAAGAHWVLGGAAPAPCPAPANAAAPRKVVRKASLVFTVPPFRRNRLDDAERLEPGPMSDERGLARGRGGEREEADLVLGNVDGSLEADARPLPRRHLGSRARPPLARVALTGGAACEKRLDEVARHPADGRRPGSA